MKILPIFYFTILNIFVWFNNRQRKIISDDKYNYVFFVSIEPIKKYENSKNYYWYKSGEIHSSEAGSHGDLLDGQYTKSHRSNHIIEQGTFKNGLKNSVWKEWYLNGKLKKTTEWKEGFKSGWSIEYSQTGEIIGGKFKKNKKHGIWLNEKTMDTLYFKEGIQIKKENKFKEKVDIFLKSIFTRKEKDQKKVERTKSNEKKTLKNQKKEKSKLL